MVQEAKLHVHHEKIKNILVNSQYYIEHDGLISFVNVKILSIFVEMIEMTLKNCRHTILTLTPVEKEVQRSKAQRIHLIHVGVPPKEFLSKY